MKCHIRGPSENFLIRQRGMIRLARPRTDTCSSVEESHGQNNHGTKTKDYTGHFLRKITIIKQERSSVCI